MPGLVTSRELTIQNVLLSFQCVWLTIEVEGEIWQIRDGSTVNRVLPVPRFGSSDPVKRKKGVVGTSETRKCRKQNPSRLHPAIPYSLLV